jgi:hypothetical protein
MLCRRSQFHSNKAESTGCIPVLLNWLSLLVQRQAFSQSYRPCLSLFFSVWRVSGECRLRSIRHSISPAAPYRRFSSCVHATQSESTSNEVTVAPGRKAARLNNPPPLPASSGRDFSFLSMMSVLRPPLREIKSGRWIG